MAAGRLLLQVPLQCDMKAKIHETFRFATSKSSRVYMPLAVSGNLAEVISVPLLLANSGPTSLGPCVRFSLSVKLVRPFAALALILRSPTSSTRCFHAPPLLAISNA